MKMRKGQMNAAGALPVLIMGVVISTILLIFGGVLGGQVYSQTASQINAITDTQIKNNITGAIQSGFTALNTTGTYLPIIVLASIIALVMAMVMGLGGLSGKGTPAGGVL